MSNENVGRDAGIHAEIGGLGDLADDIIRQRFTRAYPPARPEPGATMHFPILKGEIVTKDNFGLCDSPPVPLPEEIQDGALFLGTLDGAACVAYVLPDDTALPLGFQSVGLRALYGQVDEDAYAVAGYAVQLLHFRARYKFCPNCGTRTQNLSGGWAQECPACKNTLYPPVSPAVLALVHDGGDRILLAQKPGWGTRYSILAGFVEPGESLEGCVVREVLEEAGILVESPQYKGSQPWPFPHQIMLGFTTRYVKGEITPDSSELSDARWFRFDALPDLPPPLSLSRQLIDAWVRERQAAR